MSSSTQLRSINIICDAPPYKVVKASTRIGMRSPQDVGWCRQRVPNCQAVTQRTVLGHLWRLLFAFGLPEVEETCGCGSTLPERRFLLFRTRAGSEIRYALAQCGRCRTIVWDEEQTSVQSRSPGRHSND